MTGRPHSHSTGKSARASGIAILCLLCLVAQGCSGSKSRGRDAGAGSGAAAAHSGDLAALRAQSRALEAKVKKLEAAQGRLSSGGPRILVDTSSSKIRLMSGSRLVAEGVCSTGNGMELSDSTGKRAWTFDTPRGYFRVLGKVANPVWYRPDWSFIEEGEPIPKNRAERAEANVLGDYAISFGNGFFIHGTLYTRLLGANVTHGCIRVDDDMLRKLYAAAQPGTPIWIY